MAFFDIGINVTLNLGNTLASINQLKASMTGLQAAGAQGATGVTQMKTAVDSSTASTQNAITIYNNLGQRVQQMGAQFQATTAPIQQLMASTNQLGLTAQNTLQRIQVGGNALNQFSGQLNQSGAAFTNAERSGNRFAELFRGNRGLIFGLSATFGTITGVVFELQLMADANKQVAESQAVVNDLIARGKEGTGQFQQAQQALGKDMRFLEFSTRNLALAFTNFIPDIILVITGILNLQQKMQAFHGQLPVVAGATKVASTEIRAMGITAATSATPLGALGLAGRGAAVGMEQAAVGARILGISLRSLLISTGIGAGLVLLGLALQPIIEGFIKSREAAAATETSFGTLAGKSSELEGATTSLSNSMDTATTGMEKSVKTMADNIASHYQKLIADTLTFSKDIQNASKGVETVGPPAPEIGARGLFGGTSTTGGGELSQKDIDLITKGKIGETGKELFGPAGVVTPPPKILTPIEQFKTMQAQINSQADQLIAKMRAPGELFEGLPANIELTIDMISKGLDLWNEWQTINEKIKTEQKGVPTEEQTLRLVSIKDQITDLITGKDQLTDATKKEEEAQRAAEQTYNETQKVMNDYNSTLDKMPKILQDTGAFTKQLSDAEMQHQSIIRGSAAVFIGKAQAMQVSLGVAEQVAEQGKKLTDGLIQQRDSIAANNLIWSNMGTIVQGTTQTLGEWITAQQEAILSSIDVTAALTNQELQQFLINQGLIEGTLAAQSWLDTTIQNTAAAGQLEAEMTKLVAGIEGLPPGIKLTTEEMQAFGAEFIKTGDIVESKMIALDERFAAGRSAIGELVDAAVQGGEEFREAWKEIDKDIFPKGERGEIKDAINDFADVTQALEDLKLTVGTFQAMKSFGMLDAKEINKWSNEVKEQLRGVRSEIEDLGPVGEKLGPQIVDPFIKLAKDGLTTAELNIISQFVTEFEKIDAMEGPITPDQLRYLKQFGEELLSQTPDLEEYSVAMDELEKAADKAGKKVLTLGSGLQTLSTKKGKTPETTGLIDETISSVLGIDTTKFDDKKEQEKFLDEANKIKSAAALAQTALKNLADQGSNSISILVKNLKPHVTTIQTYFGTTIPQASGKAALSMAELMDVGTKAMALLVKNIKPHITTLNTYFGTTVFQAVTSALAAIIALQEEGTKQMATLVKNIRPHVITLDTYFGTTIPNAVDASISAFDDLGSAAGDLESDLKSLEQQAKATAAAIKKIPGGSGGGIREERAQHGFHGDVNSPTLFLAGEAGAERVDITPIGQTEGSVRRRSGGGDTVINLVVNTTNELDGEAIGTTVTRKTFRKLSTR